MKTFLIAQKTGEPQESTYTRCFHIYGRAFVFHDGIYYDWAMGVQGGGGVGCDAELAEREVVERITQARDEGRFDALFTRFPTINTGKMPTADKIPAKTEINPIWFAGIAQANYENADPLTMIPQNQAWAIGLRAEPCFHPVQRGNWDFLREKCTWVVDRISYHPNFAYVLRCTANEGFSRGSNNDAGCTRYQRDEIVGACYTFERITVCEYPTGDAQAEFIAGFGSWVVHPAEIAALREYMPEAAPEAPGLIPAVEAAQTTPEPSNEETAHVAPQPIPSTTEGANMSAPTWTGTERREPVDVLRARALYAATFGASVVITGMWIWAEFQGKPCASVLVALKKNGFRWSPKKCKWYYAGKRPSPFSKGGADWSYITEKYGEEEVTAA